MFVRLFRHIARYAPRQTGKYASKIQFKPTVDKIKTASEKNQIHSVNSSGRKTLARHKTHPAKPYNVWHLSPSKRPCSMAQKGRLSEHERRPFMKTPLNGCKFSVLPLPYLGAFTNFTASFPALTIYVPSEMAAAGIICTYVSADLPL